jgi:release factor glutamine methyltransferase
MSKLNPLIELKIAKWLLNSQELTLFSYPSLLKEYKLLDQFKQLVKKAESGYPLDYILGEVEFLQQKFKVSEAVLIPREETEWWTGELKKVFAGGDSELGIIYQLNVETNLVDLGTGSGVIGLSLSDYFQTVVMVDNSLKALQIASYNANKLTSKNSVCVKSNWLEASGIFKYICQDWILISNPPYVPDSEMIRKNLDGIAFEPEAAIFASLNGLWDFQTIVTQLGHGILNAQFKAPQLAVFELDPRNIRQAKGLFINNLSGYEAKIIKDQNRLERLLICQQLTTVN